MSPIDLWSLEEPEPFELEKLKEARTFFAIIRRRDFWETAAAAALIPIFVAIALTAPYAIGRIGAWFAVSGCIEIIVVLWLARSRMRLELDLAAYAEALRTQGTLLRWAWLWYVLPIATGGLIVALQKSLTAGHFGWLDYYFVAMELGFFGWIAWMNFEEGTRLRRLVLRDLSA